MLLAANPTLGAVVDIETDGQPTVPANGDDTCAISYRGLEAMVDQLHRTMPDQPTNPLPPRDAYLEICRELPQEMQQCLVIAHAVDHQDECERASANLDPALRARMEAMMGSGAAPAP